MISFMKKFTLTIINILTLSSCGIGRDDYNNATQQTDNYMKCIKYFIFILPLIFYLSGCGVLFDDPIERFWNNGVMPSQNEMEAYSLCIRKSEEMYPQSIDPDGSKRVPYTRACMEQKGYW